MAELLMRSDGGVADLLKVELAELFERLCGGLRQLQHRRVRHVHRRLFAEPC